MTKFQTEVKSLYDGAYLYFLVTVHEAPGIPPNLAGKQDDMLGNDSSVELFLSPNYASPGVVALPEGEQYYHLAFNSAGVKFDEVGERGGDSYKEPWEVAVKSVADGWTAEVKIPFWGKTGWEVWTPVGMVAWRLQIARNSPEDGASQLFPGKGGSRNLADFGTLTFAGETLSHEILRRLDSLQTLTPLGATLAQHLQKAPAGTTADIRKRRQDLLSAWQALTDRFADAAEDAYLKNRDTWLAEAVALSGEALAWRHQALADVIRRDDLPFGAFPHPALRDDRRANLYYIPDAKLLGQPVKLRLAKNEYEPASFLIYAPADLEELTVQISDLSGPRGTLPSSVLDAFWVKSWFQAGDFDVTRNGNFLVPELLLRDPELVTVDLGKKVNVLKDYDRDGYRSYPDDAATLQPLPRLKGGLTQQVWLTAKPTLDAAPGHYRGLIKLRAKSGEVRLPLELEILDFELAQSPISHGLYTNSNWGGIPEKQARAEMDNLLAHGASVVSLSEGLTQMPAVIDAMQGAGFDTTSVYVNNLGAWYLEQYDDAGIQKLTRSVVDALAPHGVQNVHLYLIDEARGERLQRSGAMADIVHAAGGKTWVAGYGDLVDSIGGKIDLIVMAFKPAEKSVVDKVHAFGSRLVSYGNPQCGLEKPEIYRRNYGISLWQARYDGGMTWSWCWGFSGPKSSTMWDDFDHATWRDHCMVYFTRNGLIDTIQWEGWREGYDDACYVGTLSAAAKAARQAGQTTKAQRAERWLETLRNDRSRTTGDLEALRSELIAMIRKTMPKGATWTPRPLFPRRDAR